MFFAVFMLGIVLGGVIGSAWTFDLRDRKPDPATSWSIPTISSLPRAVAVPTVTRHNQERKT